MRRWAAAGLGAAAGLMLTATAAGAQGGSAGERLLKAFDACRAIAAPEERLACFDKSTADLARAVADKQVRIVDRADVNKARRSLFGFTLPSLNLFDGGGGRDSPPFVEINTTVASATPAENGRVRLVLAEEGEPVWQTTDPMNFPPRAGAKVRIRKGALGNYFLNVDSRTYRAMRVR